MNGQTQVQISVPVLTGKNYDRWSVQMRVLFDYHELLSVVEDGIPSVAGTSTEAQRATHTDQKKKDKKALYLIHQGVNDEIFEKIADATTAKKAWDTLQTSFKGAEKVKKVRLQTLRRQYELLQMEFSESVSDYVSRLLSLVNQMKVNGEKYSEQSKIEKVLRSLAPRFEHIVVAIEEAHDVSAMTIDELTGILQAHEQHMNEKQVEKPIEQAFQSQLSTGVRCSGEANVRRDSFRGRGRGRGRGPTNYRGRGRGSSYDSQRRDRSHDRPQQNSRGRG